MTSSGRGFKHVTGKYSTPVSSYGQDWAPSACVALQQREDVRRSANGYI